MADDGKGKQKGQGQKPKPILYPITISEKEVKVRIILINTLQKRWVRLEMEDIIPPDGMFEVEGEKEYVTKVPKGITKLRIKATDVDTGTWDEITIAIPEKEKTADKKTGKMKIEILRPSGSRENFYITIITPEAKEEVVLTSNTPLTLVNLEKNEPLPITTFKKFYTGEDSVLRIMATMEKMDAVIVFEYTAGKEIQKRMLIK